MARVTPVHLRYPRTAYLVAGLLAVCVTPMVQHPLLALVYLLPLAAVLYIARAGTIVDSTGVTARAMLGAERIPWSDIEGLRVGARGEVYALVGNGEQIRLPAARMSDVPKLSAASEAATSPASGPSPRDGT